MRGESTALSLGFLSRFSAAKLSLLAATFLIFVFAGLTAAREAKAAWYSGFSLGVGEEYNDNIFFSKKKEHDWITHIVPTFKFLYAPPGETTPTFTASLSPHGQIFAQHDKRSNFGDNIAFDAAYTYRYSPRLTFNIAETFSREGLTRTAGLEALGPPPQLPATPTQLPPLGVAVPSPLIQDIGPLISKGRNVANYLSVQPAFLYSPVFTISGGLATAYSHTNEGHEHSHAAGIRGVYNWRQEHNIFGGYTVSLIDSEVVHSIDVGDDYFSAVKVNLEPTLTLSGALGVSINTGGRGPKVVNNVGLTLIKVWEKATFNAAIRRGLTGGFAISGPSAATTFSTGLGTRLTERLTGLAGVDYTLMDTDDGDINVFRTSVGLQYWMTNWLSSNFWYSYRWRSVAVGASDVPAGRAGGHSVLLALSVHFDVFPNRGLARGTLHPLYPPMGAPVYQAPQLQQPLRAPTAPAEMQQQRQQPLGAEPARPQSTPPAPESQPEPR